MNRQTITALYVLVMAAIIIGVDVAFFRGRFWDRLLANIGVIAIFAAFYMRFIRYL